MAIVNLLIMATNEEKSIKTTLDSVKDYFDNIIFFHNKSTDNTIKIVKDHCEEKKLKLHIGEGYFTNYSESRNRSIEFAEKIKGDFIVMLDAGDELRFEKKIPTKKQFKKIFTSLMNDPQLTKYNAFVLKKLWRENTSVNEGNDSEKKDSEKEIITDKKKGIKETVMFDVKMFRTGRNFRYTASVHEVPDPKFIKYDTILNCHDIFYIYQDREKFAKKSYERRDWDLKVLLEDLKKDPDNLRIIGYIGQTYASLNDFQNSYLYFNKGIEIIENEKKRGTKEDNKDLYVNKGNFYLRAGLSLKELDPLDERIEPLLIKAYKTDNKNMETLIYLTLYYMEDQDWKKAYKYINYACKLEYPSHTAEIIVGTYYSYTRYHLKSVVCSSLLREGDDRKGGNNMMKEAIEACEKAIKSQNKQIDIDNLQKLKKLNVSFISNNGS